MKTISKHAVLPNGFDLGSPELAAWLQAQSVQTFIDTKKEFYSPEDLQGFEHESSMNGREFNRLAELKKKVSDLCVKGTEVPVTIVIPATAGSKLLELQRRQNDDMIETGFEQFDVEVYSIPDADNGTMEFFDADGKHYADRTRPLSISEKHKYGGIFNIDKRNVVRDGNNDVDSSTGEVLDGTHN